MGRRYFIGFVAFVVAAVVTGVVGLMMYRRVRGAGAVQLLGFIFISVAVGTMKLADRIGLIPMAPPEAPSILLRDERVARPARPRSTRVNQLQETDR